jgi:FkbM family methyltransferase
VAELDAFIASCSAGMRLMDVGAHFGLFSLAALHFGGPEARALAIDPSSVAVRMLNSQARLNSCTSRLQILKAAIGGSSGTIQLVDAGVMSSGYMVPNEENRPPSDLTTVRLNSLDDLVSTFDFQPTHVKIDVEGEEAAVIEGAQQLLARPDAPLLFVELHNRLARRLGRQPAATLNMLVRMNYRLFSSDGRPREAGDLLDQDLVRVVAAKQTQTDAVNRIRSAQPRSASSSP